MKVSREPHWRSATPKEELNWLAQNYGGRAIMVSKARPSNIWENAPTFANLVVGTRAYIPKDAGRLMELRNKVIREYMDKRLNEKANMVEIINECVVIYGLSDRMLYRIAKGI